uniref:Uncharacterized protein n=1 Tax=Anguilla anguilla TaxID=7936 RepID=A0A0E9SCS2_ANGAN
MVSCCSFLPRSSHESLSFPSLLAYARKM